MPILAGDLSGQIDTSPAPIIHRDPYAPPPLPPSPNMCRPPPGEEAEEPSWWQRKLERVGRWLSGEGEGLGGVDLSDKIDTSPAPLIEKPADDPWTDIWDE